MLLFCTLLNNVVLPFEILRSTWESFMVQLMQFIDGTDKTNSSLIQAPFLQARLEKGFQDLFDAE